MKKILIFGLVLSVAYAAGAVAASLAFAVAEVLVGGQEIGERISTEISGEVALEDMDLDIGVLCSYAFAGYFEAKADVALIEAVLNLRGALTKVVSARSGDGLECDAHTACDNPTLIIFTGLPWRMGLELDAPDEYKFRIVGEAGQSPGYVLLCETLGLLGRVEDECHNDLHVSLFNEARGLLSEFSANEEINPVGTCSLTGAEASLIVSGDGFITSPSGALTMSGT